MHVKMKIRLLKVPNVQFWSLRIHQNYSKDGKDAKEGKCPCMKDGGECRCWPECQCPHCKLRNALRRLGASPRNSRDHPEGCAPKSLETTAFSSPDFVPSYTYRIVEREEPLGPNAGKCRTYKNPEYYSYYRFSYYDLITIINTIKKRRSAKHSK